LGVQKLALHATVQEVMQRLREATVGSRQNARAQAVSKTENVTCISGPAVVGVKKEHQAQSMAAQHRLCLGSILSMRLWCDPLSRHVNGDNYPLGMYELHQSTL